MRTRRSPTDVGNRYLKVTARLCRCDTRVVTVPAGFREVGADAVPMPSIPEMGAVWEFWGVTEANILGGADPVRDRKSVV